MLKNMLGSFKSCEEEGATVTAISTSVSDFKSDHKTMSSSELQSQDAWAWAWDQL